MDAPPGCGLTSSAPVLGDCVAWRRRASGPGRQVYRDVLFVVHRARRTRRPLSRSSLWKGFTRCSEVDLWRAAVVFATASFAFGGLAQAATANSVVGRMGQLAPSQSAASPTGEAPPRRSRRPTTPAPSDHRRLSGLRWNAPARGKRRHNRSASNVATRAAPSGATGR